MTTWPTSWILVLGMHRSGTSCLAGILDACGAHLGDVATSSPCNRKGNRELEGVWRLNDDVLHENDGRWDDPPDKVDLTNEHRLRRDQILRDLQVARPRVACIKDPRLLLTLELWQEALPLESTRIVASIREPAGVALSLAARDGIRHPEALRLWRSYNQRLLTLGNERVSAVIDFSLPADQYLGHAEALTRGLGLTWTAEGRGFFDESLRESKGAEVAVAARDLELYQRLRGMSVPTSPLPRR